jgi:teichuronic acid biosynthesis glycosyltransferase TuaC
MKVAVVAEFYPRAADPVLGVWAHRQAVAARDAGADVRVIVLHRPLPSMAAATAGPKAAARATARALAQPRRAVLDDIDISYVPFLAPPRAGGYGDWGRWAAPSLSVALRALRKRFPYDLVHAHNAVPAGEAVRRAGLPTPYVVSVHGGDVFHTARASAGGAEAVRATFARSRLVLANSAAIEHACRVLGAPATRVVHLGSDLPQRREPPYPDPTVVTTAHLIARKRHRDVLAAIAQRPSLRYLVIGDGPELVSLKQLAATLGVADRVEFAGQLHHQQALRRTRRAHVFAMPSTDEAFGVAYLEAMAGWLPAIGARGEPGPEEIAARGGGMTTVPAGDSGALAEAIDALIEDATQAQRARRTVEQHFSWDACGAATVAAYEDAVMR